MLTLKQERELTMIERTMYVVFIINVFQSLENETIRAVALPLVSLPLWHALSPGRLQARLGALHAGTLICGKSACADTHAACARLHDAFQLELAHHPQLEKHWRYLQRKEAKAAKQHGHVPNTQQPAARFVPELVEEFLQTLRIAVADGDHVDGATRAYCEVRACACFFILSLFDLRSVNSTEQRFLELLIDLLSQLPTRRFVRTVLEDRAVLVKCRLAPLFSQPSGRLFSQLVDLFRFYQGFEINDHTGTQLTDDEFASAHYERLQQLQRLAFKHIPALNELALSNCAAIERRPALTRHLQSLGVAELARLATRQLRLTSPDDPWASDPRFLLELVVSSFEKRRSQRQAVSEMPLYPNEDVLWDENVVPSIAYNGEGCLALPKLNLQFLTFHDYLLRNFNLFRLEATYEIREDLADVLSRVGPVAHPEAEGRVQFTGWARMAVPPTSFSIVEVRKPNVGEAKPSSVTAEIRFDLATLRPPVRAEWDELRQHDVLFLLVRGSLCGRMPRKTVMCVVRAELACAHVPPCLRRQLCRPATGLQRRCVCSGRQSVQIALFFCLTCTRHCRHCRLARIAQTAAERYGLRHVRGCEVIELRDAEGKLMNDFSGRSRREQGAQGPPRGTERTLLVSLDTAQYQVRHARKMSSSCLTPS